jgi:hypothetical protein
MAGVLKIRRFIEVLSLGGPTGFQCFASEDYDQLPPPKANARWLLDETFDEQSALDARPGLKNVLERARSAGVAVMRPAKTSESSDGVPTLKPQGKGDDHANKGLDRGLDSDSLDSSKTTADDSKE